MPSNSNTKTIEKFGPKPVKDLMVAAALLGFQPSRPKSYPLGFVPYAEQIVGKEAEPAYGTRLTDGMALVTVYQWPYTGSRKKPLWGQYEPYYVDRANNIAFTALGDLPPSALKTLATAQAKSQ